MSLEPCAPSPALKITFEDPVHAHEVDALIDRAFGPGRFAKSSERVREFADFAPELSACAFDDDGRLLGAVRMWRVAVGGQPAIFLGPIAVESSDRNGGLGGVLVARACEAAKAAGESAVVLVGDLPYFGRFGFEVAPGVGLPGPVDPGRVLVRKFEDVAVQGPIAPR